MKLRIVRVEALENSEKKITVSYCVERKILFWWERLLHPWLPTMEAAEEYVEEYLKLKGRKKRTVIREYETK